MSSVPYPRIATNFSGSEEKQTSIDNLLEQKIEGDLHHDVSIFILCIGHVGRINRVSHTGGVGRIGVGHIVSIGMRAVFHHH